MYKARLEELKALKKQAKDKSKDKPFKTMSSKEKDELLEIALRMLGLIE